MSGKILPGNSDGFNFKPSLSTLVKIVSGGVAGDQVRHNSQQHHHFRAERNINRMIALNKGSINPNQFIALSAQDNVPHDIIKSNLKMWGKKWERFDFAKPDTFSLEPHKVISKDSWKRAVGIQDTSYQLSMNPNTSSKDRFRRRGGYTPPTESERILEDRAEMTTNQHEYCPNLSHEVCERHGKGFNDEYIKGVNEEYTEGVNDECEYIEGVEPGARTYDFPVPDRTPAIFYYIAGIGFVFISSFLLEFTQRKFSKWIGSKDSQPLVSKLKEIGLLDSSKKPQSEEQGLQAEEEATSPNSDRMLEVFISYRRRKITKKQAICVLIKCYNLSETEAIELLK